MNTMKNVKIDFLDMIMNKNYHTSLTICGSMDKINLMKWYEAYYAMHNNLIYMPISTSKEFKNDIERKIKLSQGIIFISNKSGFVSEYMIELIAIAKKYNKKIIFNNIKDKSEPDEYYFNNNQTYPLYMLKEE